MAYFVATACTVIPSSDGYRASAARYARLTPKFVGRVVR
jgi:hypothetical protein